MNTADNLTIRPYHDKDAAILGDIFHRSIMAIDERLYNAKQKRAWAGNKTLDFWQQRFAQTQPFVACLSDQAAGFLELIYKDAYIDCCYVDLEHQGKGIASALIRHAIDSAKVHNIDTLTVHASDVALPIFSRHGFTIIKRQQHETQDTLLANTLMRYSIK
ncbi:GNAT family N-acetyltransferase [Cardiobacteriaceae bacterium TAE3-ERU3]|nr:GNAT family N-acetyltransferase [Cardiobacteriaceae bacterium TAE3-ERU3]